MVYTDDTDASQMDFAFLKALFTFGREILVVVCAIVQPSEPLGDARNERYEMVECWLVD